MNTAIKMLFKSLLLIGFFQALPTFGLPAQLIVQKSPMEKSLYQLQSTPRLIKRMEGKAAGSLAESVDNSAVKAEAQSQITEETSTHNGNKFSFEYIKNNIKNLWKNHKIKKAKDAEIKRIAAQEPEETYHYPTDAPDNEEAGIGDEEP